MRIRRNASKLLGSSTLYAIPPPPPTGCAAAAAVKAEYREEGNNNNNCSNSNDNNNVCELNCSPWDLLLLNLDSNLDDYFLTDHSQEGEDKGVFGNLTKTEQAEEEPVLPPPAIASSAAEFADEKKLITQEKGRTRKKKAYCKGKEDRDSTAETPANNNSSSYCKKSDGKGWHCKQRAKLPHSLCGYHLAQVRSYTSSSKPEAIDGMASGTDNYNSDPSDLYYYYEGFRPWRGKRRGSVPACNGREGRDEDRSGCEIKMHGGDVGDDGYDLDRLDDDNEDHEDYGIKQDDEVKRRSGELEKKRRAVVKRRGRKPFKCRSLKSLL